MELTLGPVLFDWTREELLDFYKKAASLDVETVYIGELVCVKRKGLSVDDISEIAALLTAAGKEVILSTPVVVSNEEELRHVRSLEECGLPIEANDASALGLFEESGLLRAAGPHITSYNAPDVEFLRSLGIARITFPVELPAESVAYNIEKTGIKAELFAHGKVPLAFSWRCYTSRSFGRSKSDCRLDCSKFPEGMDIKTLDGEPIFNINGTSIVSADTYSMIGLTDALGESGVSALRISPHQEHTADIVALFRERLGGAITAEAAVKECERIHNGRLSNGWFAARAGKDYIEEVEALII